MKRALIMVSPGFEETELVTTTNILKREGILVSLMSINKKKVVKGNSFVSIETNIFINNVVVQDYDVLVLPGGTNGTNFAIENQKLLSLVTNFNDNKKLIAAICAAPSILTKQGLTKKGLFTQYWGMDKNSNNQEFFIEDRIITGRDYLSTDKFAFAISNKLK
ncbi:MAG: DJ-1/PfpI family protein [Mollicutes bacterium PWAP]|nr:DJ-1/PfpI family protein [Mollicutes bacterium PWAP]